MRTQLVSDEELIARVRSGDTDAYGQLFDRHRKSAMTAAVAHIGRKAQAEDVVADSFARVLVAIQAGHGPHVAFRPYLLTTVRHTAVDRGRSAARELPVGAFADDELQFETDDEQVAELERTVAARAYAQLPERWRAVLWYSEIEQMRPAKFGPLMGLTPNAAAALAVRAREGLRDAYVQAHLESEVPDRCRPTVDVLGQYLRGSLCTRDRSRVDEHLDGCGRCGALYAELRDVAGGVRAVIGVLILGGAAAKAFLSSGGPSWLLHVPKPSGKTAIARSGAAATAAVITGFAIGFGGTEPKPAPNFAAERNATSATRVQTPFVSAAPTASSRPIAPTTATTTPGSARPLPTSTATTSVPSSSSPTTIDRQGSTTTATTAPLATLDLSARVDPVGQIVRGRPATLVVTAVASGSGIADDVHVDLSLAGSSTSLTSVNGAGWACTATASTASCSIDQLAALSSRTITVSLAPPTTATGVVVRAEIASSQADANSVDNVVNRTIPAAKSGLAPRFAQEIQGTTLVAGNTILSCDVLAPGCAGAQRFGGGVDELANDAWVMRTIDYDADGSTTNSSSAQLQIPSGSQVAFAGLYWNGDLLQGVGGTRPIATATRTATLIGARGGRSTVSAQRYDMVNSHYQGFADVTGFVATQGSGTYTGANLAVATGRGRSGGWSIVVVIRNSALPLRSIAVFDGLEYVTSAGSANAYIPAYTQANSSASILTGTYDGDRGSHGDICQANGVAIGVSNDYADSSLASGGAISVTGGNGFGMDLDVSHSSTAARAGGVMLRCATNGDRFYVGFASISVDL